MDTLVRGFERHIALSDPARTDPLYRLVPITPPLLALATALCNHHWQAQPHPLRSLDAIQLACALAVSVNLADELIVVTADVRLAAIASLEGLRVVNPTFPPHP
jgi:hypothetical protein